MTDGSINLAGKSAVVIGGTSGIGHAIAMGFARAGADVAATSRRAEEVENAVREIEKAGRRSLRLTSDVTDRASLEKLLEASVKAFGKVDIMLNAAGRTKRHGPPLGRPFRPSFAHFRVGRLRLELRTNGLKIRCSNQLSYRPVQRGPAREARFLAQRGWGTPHFVCTA